MANQSSAPEPGRLLGRWSPEVVPGLSDLAPGSGDAGAVNTAADHELRAAGDPVVIAALELGWEMADLYAVRTPPPTTDEAPSTLPPASELAKSPAAGIERLSSLIARALTDTTAGATPSVEALNQVSAENATAWREALLHLHGQLATSLGAGDPACLGAYDVGRALSDTCREPRDLSELIDRLDSPSLLAVEGRLADLSSRLPPHSAAAVAATLAQWKAWTADARAREDLNEVRGALVRQGALWRALLTGEKDAREMLDPEMVIAASVRHASRLGTLIRGLAGAYLPATGLLVAVSVLLVYVIIVQSPIATVVATLGALAGVLIVLRKALSLTVVETIENLRPGLWGAEIDAAVAQSVLRLPPRAPVTPRSKPTPTAAAPPPLPGQPESISARLAHRIERALHVTRSAKAQGFRVPASGPATTAAPPPADAPKVNGNHP